MHNKKTFYLFLLFLFVACGKKTEIPPKKNSASVVQTAPSKILLLKVDFKNKVFEGGTEINLSPHTYTIDSIPVKKEYEPPGDFGNLRFLYKPTNDTLFDGSIVWMGKGNLKFPRSFDTSTKFVRLSYHINNPDSNRFQKIHHTMDSGPWWRDSIPPWESIDKLEVVKSYLNARKKIGYFLYSPSVGIGNPAEWDWFFILSK